MLKMFKFDVFSACHSLCQLVAGIALFLLWLISQEYNFTEHFIKYRIFVLGFKIAFKIFAPIDVFVNSKIFFCFIIYNANFLIIFLPVCFSVCTKFVCLIFNIFFCLSDLSITSVLSCPALPLFLCFCFYRILLY